MPGGQQKAKINKDEQGVGGEALHDGRHRGKILAWIEVPHHPVDGVYTVDVERPGGAEDHGVQMRARTRQRLDEAARFADHNADTKRQQNRPQQDREALGGIRSERGYAPPDHPAKPIDHDREKQGQGERRDDIRHPTNGRAGDNNGQDDQGISGRGRGRCGVHGVVSGASDTEKSPGHPAIG